ncbi:MULTISPECIES: sporulation protein YqfD [unclassified Paenibacillus]|uniref:sporulation protein YqfD n=1 Tax=unclassified Paenibacillus TaxID=185978 RepID=UPI001C107A55|nr:MULTISPECIES: sporulation protein YqfD [unclassified Paenibacillus]MBU5440461.1 sporulation protein YqfD [Paenibacillus sp. MSJ-34]CAH0119617.1 hypothetical protein PAE9249_02122 [Paenibacillus sp. CECT 9249]
MNSPTLAKFRGYVTIAVRGENLETFVNEATFKQIEIWNIRRISDQAASMNVLLRDFFKLRPLLKQTSCRIHVEERVGFPFLLDKLGKRKALIAGGLLFMAGLYLLSSLVWDIEVSGNVNIPKEEILQAAREEGIYPFQWTFRLDSQETLSKSLARRLPDTSWVGVEKKGTTISIQIVESTKPERRPLLNPRHLVSKADAVVTHIYAEQGQAVVGKHSRVKKGSVLISGIIGEAGYQRTVVAKGSVRGLVWHEYNIASPLVRKQKTYTGEWRERKYIVVGNRAVQISGYGQLPFEQFETVAEREQARVGNRTLPFGIMTEKIMEVRYVEQPLSEEEAKNVGLELARADISRKNGADAKIEAEKILHQKTDNGKVYMNVLFEVEQAIAEELPLVQD